MKNIIEKMLDSYERGGIGRREFIQALALITVTPPLLAESAKPAFQGKTLNHVTLAVKDVANSCNFYQRLLNLPVRIKEEDYCSLDLGESFMALYKDTETAGTDHFCIGIESFEADGVLAKLKKEFPHHNPTMENDKEVYLRDPDNIRFQLSSMKYKH